MVISTALNWHDAVSIVAATVLAFVFGYSFTLVPLLGSGLRFGDALRIALAGDTVSISVMELVDNGVVLVVPGAMSAGLTDALFWGSLALGLVLAFVAAFPVNSWMISRGLGRGAHGHH